MLLKAHDTPSGDIQNSCEVSTKKSVELESIVQSLVCVCVLFKFILCVLYSIKCIYL